jgi:nitrogen regulatory protein PII
MVYDHKTDAMKMLTIICRNTLEGDVRRLLNDLAVDGYTVTSGLGGKGQTGSVSEHNWMERNVSFMTALEDERVAALADAVKQLYVKLLEANQGEEVPLKVFVQPCDVIL